MQKYQKCEIQNIECEMAEFAVSSKLQFTPDQGIQSDAAEPVTA